MVPVGHLVMKNGRTVVDVLRPAAVGGWRCRLWWRCNAWAFERFPGRGATGVKSVTACQECLVLSCGQYYRFGTMVRPTYVTIGEWGFHSADQDMGRVSPLAC